MLGKMMVSMLALTGVAYAQEQAPAANADVGAVSPAQSGADRVGYDAAFFAQFNPQTALDMVRQTPGFSIEDPNQSNDARRGFSGAVGNLLIDGLRPSAKSQSLENLLAQIPATQVVRIELLRGAAVAGDASGATVIANVVRTPSTGSGLWNLGLGQHGDAVRPFGDASYTGRVGQFEYGFGGSYYQDTREQPGFRVEEDGAGNRTGLMITPSPRNVREAVVNANAAVPLLGGRLSATGQASWFRWHASHQFIHFTPDGENDFTFLDSFTESRPRPAFEVGLNYDRDIGPWSMALVGLVNRRDYGSNDTFAVLVPDGVAEVNYVEVRQDSGESILRGTLSRALTPTQRIEFGAEGALNTLDASLNLLVDTGSGPLPPPNGIPNANVTVEEERTEVFAVHTWRPNDTWSLESRLAREMSTLTFTGDADQTVDLSYLKPSIQLTRNFGENNQARIRLYRDVGQLDFGDFVSAPAFADSRIDGGNPGLVPETSYRAEIGADWRFAGGVALGLAVTQYWISDVADLVPLTDNRGTSDPSDDVTFDAPGNIGDANGTRLDANLTLPLGFVLPGGRFTMSGFLWRGEVTDPVTGQERALSERSESQLDFEIRQDLPQHKLAWSISLSKPGEVPYYRLNEVDTQEEGPWVDGYIETTALPHGMRLRLSAINIFDGDIRRNRQIYLGDRNGPLDRVEWRYRNFVDSPWFELRLSGSF